MFCLCCLIAFSNSSFVFTCFAGKDFFFVALFVEFEESGEDFVADFVRPAVAPGLLTLAGFAFRLVILVVLFEPGGLVGLGHRLRHLRGRRTTGASHPGGGSHRAENPPSASADPSSGGNPT